MNFRSTVAKTLDMITEKNIDDKVNTSVNKIKQTSVVLTD